VRFKSLSEKLIGLDRFWPLEKIGSMRYGIACYSRRKAWTHGPHGWFTPAT
jgi:hypothetical protein